MCLNENPTWRSGKTEQADERTVAVVKKFITQNPNFKRMDYAKTLAEDILRVNKTGSDDKDSSTPNDTHPDRMTSPILDSSRANSTDQKDVSPEPTEPRGDGGWKIVLAVTVPVAAVFIFII